MAKKLKSECFDIFNINGKPVLFRTDDGSVNKLTFKAATINKDLLAFFMIVF